MNAELTVLSGGAICNGGEAFEARRILFCPTEQRRRRFYTRFQHWYGWEYYCLGCGDRWAGDGERGERPFERAWRTKAMRRHADWWSATPIGNGRARQAAFREFVEAYFA